MKISIIGAGTMGGAMVEGLIKGEYIKNEDRMEQEEQWLVQQQ